MDRRELWAVDVDVLRDARRMRCWSRNALARAAGLSHHTVVKAERGEPLFPESVKLMALALDVPIEAMRAKSVHETAVSGNERRMMDLVRHQIETFFAACIESNRAVLRTECCKHLDPNVVWSASSVKIGEAPFLGTFHRVDEVLNYMDASMDVAVREKMWSVESFRCLDSRRVIMVAGEDVAVPSFGKRVHAEAVLIWTLDGKPGRQRITAFHQHTDRLEFVGDL
jgi:transcriptional regulator with XRE-family HTH domain